MESNATIIFYDVANICPVTFHIDFKCLCFFTYIDPKGLKKMFPFFPFTFSWENSRWPPPVTKSLIIAISLAINGIETCMCTFMRTFFHVDLMSFRY